MNLSPKFLDRSAHLLEQGGLVLRQGKKLFLHRGYPLVKSAQGSSSALIHFGCSMGCVATPMVAGAGAAVIGAPAFPRIVAA